MDKATALQKQLADAEAEVRAEQTQVSSLETELASTEAALDAQAATSTTRLNASAAQVPSA